jgi:hypothetical protein
MLGHADSAAHWTQRLESGLEHDLGLIIAKSVQGQISAAVTPADIVRQVALFGASNRDGRGVGLTILVALANLLPALPEEDVYLALFHGARRVGQDCADQPPRRPRHAHADEPVQLSHIIAPAALLKREIANVVDRRGIHFAPAAGILFQRSALLPRWRDIKER